MFVLVDLYSRMVTYNVSHVPLAKTRFYFSDLLSVWDLQTISTLLAQMVL